MPSRPTHTHAQDTRRQTRESFSADPFARDERGEHDAIRHTARWQRVREIVRRRDPICQDPLGHHREDGVVVPTEEVHHRAPLGQRPDLAYDPANLVGLCRRCHAQVEARDRAGATPWGGAVESL